MASTQDELERLSAALADRYAIEREIGSGGMATVYLAEDLRHQRKVAVKVLDPDLGAAIGAERFLREIQTAAKLTHPHILPLHDSGDAGGFLYYVMPFVKGESLRVTLDRDRQLPVEDAIRYTREIAGALAYAHEEGIVHRDVKPANILLEAGHAVLMDFGIAQAAAQATDTRLTHTGVSLGTPAYMSPEQVTGEGHLDARSDQYALACVLFEMLMGEPPFTGVTTAQILAKKLSETPSRVSSLRSSVNAHLDEVIARALDTTPADRFPSMGAFADALLGPSGASYRSGFDPGTQLGANEGIQTGVEHGAVGGIPTGGSQAAPPPVPPVSQPKPRRVRRIVARVASGVLLAALVFVGGFLFLGSTNDLGFQSRDWILITGFQNNTGQSVFDRSLENALSVGIQQSNHVNVFPKTRVAQTLQRMLKDDPGTLDEALGREVAIRENIRLVAIPSIDQVGDTYVLAIRVVDASTGEDLLSRAEQAEGSNDVLPALDRLAKQFRRDLGESRFAISRQSVPLRAATTPSLEALEAWSEADFHWGRRNYDEAFSLLERAIELDSMFAMAHADLGGAYYLLGNREKGDFHTGKALSLTDRVTERERLWIVAEIENWKENYEGAIEAYNIYLTRYPDDLDGWFRLGYAQMREGRHAEAARAFQSVVEMDPENTAGFINLATTLSLLNRREEAAEQYLKAFELAPDWLTSGNLNHEFGFNYVAMGEFEKAESTFRLMLEGDDDQRALGHRSLALMEMYLGRYKEARDHLREAAFLHAALGSGLSEMRNRLYLVSALLASDSLAEAAAEMVTVVGLADSENVAPSWLANIGKVQARAGMVDEARETLSKASQRADETLQADRASVALIRGELALAQGDVAGGLADLRLAHTLRENPYQLESLAYGLYRSGDLDGALDLYLPFLAEPELGWEVQEFWVGSHLRVAEIYEELGDVSKAREFYQVLLDMWAGGDPDLVALKEAGERMGALKGGES